MTDERELRAAPVDALAACGAIVARILMQGFRVLTMPHGSSTGGPRRLSGGLVILACALTIPDLANARETAPRQRISINENWRFTKGDPIGAPPILLYDVRPVVKQSADGKAADAKPEEAEKIQGGVVQVLKPWILPTGNAFLKDPAKRHLRPAGNPGGEVSYVQPGFDDRSWEAVTLPHDWAIKGPFLSTGPYGGVGRLPSWGVGWYRKALDIPAGDAGKSIFLDIDGAMYVLLNSLLRISRPVRSAERRLRGCDPCLAATTVVPRAPD